MVLVVAHKEEWSAEKRIVQTEIYQGLHTELEEILLSEIAYSGFDADRLFYSQSEIVSQIRSFLANNLNVPQNLNGEAVLNAIAVQQGILVERASDVFSFSHLTLQEYLTAYYIHEHNEYQKLVNQHLADKRWREVFLLVSGLMARGADHLLLLMGKKARSYIDTAKLQALLHWADEATGGSEADIKPAGKRAIAYAKADAYVKANTFASTFANTFAVDASQSLCRRQSQPPKTTPKSTLTPKSPKPTRSISPCSERSTRSSST